MQIPILWRSSLKIFADDIEQAIQSSENINLKVGEVDEIDRCGKYLSEYLKEHFKITVDGQLKDMEYLGHEMDRMDAVWVFFEAFEVDDPSEILIENTILIEEFEEQRNIVYYGKSDGRPYTAFLAKDKTLELIQIKE